jgi:hypothetical protein
MAYKHCESKMHFLMLMQVLEYSNQCDLEVSMYKKWQMHTYCICSQVFYAVLVLLVSD